MNENGVTELSIDHDDTDDIMDVGINEGMDITSFIIVSKNEPVSSKILNFWPNVMIQIEKNPLQNR